MTTSSVEKFQIHVDQHVLDDLELRLSRTRWPPGPSPAGWQAGVNECYLRELIEYWRSEFDWRAVETSINRYPNFRVVIDDVPIHFIHLRGRGPNPLPLLLNHGWPWTFWDFEKVLAPLADPAAFGADAKDSFDVILPSLPGFGFSAPLPRRVNFWETADLWVTLVKDLLGYAQFVAHGADWGARICAQLGHKYSQDVIGIHLTWTPTLDRYGSERPWELAQPSRALPPDERARALTRQREMASHVAVHILDPQTQAYALHDSPIGLCAWLLQRRRHWSDCLGDVERRFDKNDLITTSMLYWVSETIGTSMHYYREATIRPWKPSHDRTPVVGTPTMISKFAGDPSPMLCENELRGYYDVRWIKKRLSGGHFAAAEEPDALVEDIREAFRPFRGYKGLREDGFQRYPHQ